MPRLVSSIMGEVLSGQITRVQLTHNSLFSPLPRCPCIVFSCWADFTVDSDEIMKCLPTTTTRRCGMPDIKPHLYSTTTSWCGKHDSKPHLYSTTTRWCGKPDSKQLSRQKSCGRRCTSRRTSRSTQGLCTGTKHGNNSTAPYDTVTIVSRPMIR